VPRNFQQLSNYPLAGEKSLQSVKAYCRKQNFYLSQNSCSSIDDKQVAAKPSQSQTRG